MTNFMNNDSKSLINDLCAKKAQSHKISMITCYDYPSSVLVQQSQLDFAFVGDSLGTNVLGYKSEKEVTVDDIVHHTKAVSRGLSSVKLIADLPYGSYNNEKDLIYNARRLIQAGATLVKFEGFYPQYVKALKNNNISVVCHLGLLPQVHEKKSVQANSYGSAKRLIEQSLDLEKSGACILVLELVPEEVAQIVSRLLKIPVIGIAAGRFCDGQVQIWHDVLGLSNKSYKHITKYEDLNQRCLQSLKKYKQDILEDTFLTSQQSFKIDSNIVERLNDVFFN